MLKTIGSEGLGYIKPCEKHLVQIRDKKNERMKERVGGGRDGKYCFKRV